MKNVLKRFFRYLRQVGSVIRRYPQFKKLFQTVLKKFSSTIDENNGSRLICWKAYVCNILYGMTPNEFFLFGLYSKHARCSNL